MEGTAGRGPCFLHGIPRKKMEDLRDQAGAAESFLHVVTLQINVRIDFVSEAVVTFVAFEPNIVSRSADPQRFAVACESRFPNTQMIAGPDHIDRLGMRPAIILRTAEEIERAHGHGEIRFLRKTADQTVENRILYV